MDRDMLNHGPIPEMQWSGLGTHPLRDTWSLRIQVDQIHMAYEADVSYGGHLGIHGTTDHLHDICTE